MKKPVGDLGIVLASETHFTSLCFYAHFHAGDRLCAKNRGKKRGHDSPLW
jgi:hypothetical protein